MLVSMANSVDTAHRLASKRRVALPPSEVAVFPKVSKVPATIFGVPARLCLRRLRPPLPYLLQLVPAGVLCLLYRLGRCWLR